MKGLGMFLAGLGVLAVLLIVVVLGIAFFGPQEKGTIAQEEQVEEPMDEATARALAIQRARGR